MTTTIQLHTLTTSANTQKRAALDRDAVTDYGEMLAAGEVLPPIRVVRLVAGEAGLPEGAMILAEGFHRVTAALERGITELPAEIQDGTLADAHDIAYRANARHGVRQSRADLRRKVTEILQDPAYAGLGVRELARITGASHPTVIRIKEELAAAAAPKPVKPPRVPGAEPKPGNPWGDEQEPEAGEPLPPSDEAPRPQASIRDLPPLRKMDPIDTLLTYAMHRGDLEPQVFQVFGGTVTVTATYERATRFDA